MEVDENKEIGVWLQTDMQAAVQEDYPGMNTDDTFDITGSLLRDERKLFQEYQGDVDQLQDWLDEHLGLADVAKAIMRLREVVPGEPEESRIARLDFAMGVLCDWRRDSLLNCMRWLVDPDSVLRTPRTLHELLLRLSAFVDSSNPTRERISLAVGYCRREFNDGAVTSCVRLVVDLPGMAEQRAWAECGTRGLSDAAYTETRDVALIHREEILSALFRAVAEECSAERFSADRANDINQRLWYIVQGRYTE